jgi:hypothetical protein
MDLTDFGQPPPEQLQPSIEAKITSDENSASRLIGSGPQFLQSSYFGCDWFFYQEVATGCDRFVGIAKVAVCVGCNDCHPAARLRSIDDAVVHLISRLPKLIVAARTNRNSYSSAI